MIYATVLYTDGGRELLEVFDNEAEAKRDARAYLKRWRSDDPDMQITCFSTNTDPDSIEDFADINGKELWSMTCDDVTASKQVRKFSIKASNRCAKRKVMAARLGDFTDMDFKRMMEGIVENIVADWDPANGDPDDFIRTQLDYEIERECTYYSDCINIIWGSNTTDWSDADYPISSLGSLAGWIIEREFYQEGYYDDALERMTGEDEDEEEY